VVPTRQDLVNEILDCFHPVRMVDTVGVPRIERGVGRAVLAISGGLSRRRQLLGALAGLVGLTALSFGLAPRRDDLAVESVLLLFLLVVVAAAAVGGVWPALATSVVAFGLVNWYFTPPYHTLAIADGQHVLALVVFLVVASVVALYVTVADRLASESADVRAEAAALDRTNELRTALLSAVSHDLRTPLASIKASVSSLRAGDVHWSDAETAEFLEAIEDDTDRLNQLVGNLLDMSRLQAGALELTRQAVALEEVVANALDGLGAQAANVVSEVPEDLPLAMVDPGLLERAVANVVANATHWTPPGEPVVIRARLAAPDLELRVIDHGPGVPPEARDRIFRPFQRLGDHGGAGVGVGLGLAIASGFVEAMGGELLVDDTPGGGATFRIVVTAAAP
jgi:two-component system sensor histidine kinase KdpD